MNKQLIIMGLFLILLITPTFTLADIEVEQLREHAFIILNMANDSYIQTGRRFFVVNNVDKRQMFLTMQVIPIPSGVLCYGQHDWCDNSTWDTTIEVNYVGSDGITNKVMADTISCWNWWNVGGLTPLCDPDYYWWDVFHLFPVYHCTVSSQLDMLFNLEENKTLCPIVSIPFSPQDKYLNISFNMTPDTGKAMPNLNARVFEYSTAYTDRPTQYSSTANRSIIAIAELIRIQMNVAKLLYYSLIIALIVVGILVFVGAIPILIKWIMSRLVR